MKGNISPPALASTLAQAGFGELLKPVPETGAGGAVAYLGNPGGFLASPKVPIGLPDSPERVATGLRGAGQ